MKKSNSTTAVAGEYFVAAELARRGHIALITLRNTESVDILASNAEGTRSVSIQVKTRSGKAHNWPLNVKAEKISSPNLFYVFVTLRGAQERPNYFIVPSAKVARTVAESHAAWLKRPGKKGQMHKDTPIRQFRAYESYREKWDLLGL
ncbi:MAG: aspartate ammonia-lyase [Syntrophomonadaceae bacterium]|nr:aspartate ammonia-lyase [Syntrophomonadaceae bacterium]